MPAPASTEPGDPVRVATVVGAVLVLTALLTVWAAFLVPVRLGGVPVPVWLVPLAAMVVAAAAAGRRVGLPGALAPALVWLALSWLVLGVERSEGDLVVPGTLSGYAYLFGGLLAWGAVVARSAGPSRPRPSTSSGPDPRSRAATPGAAARR